MKEALLPRIRQFGHWRVNFRPVAMPLQMLSLQQCKEAVEKAAVSIRGWDFPHFNRGRNDDSGGFERTNEYVESWTDWSGMIEFWRMYRSSQFLSYVALREDTRADGEDGPDPVLNFIGTVYSVTEFFEFAHRLAKGGLYAEGLSASISLRNTAGRVLVAGRGRIPFFDDYNTGAENLDFERSLSPTVLKESHREVAVQVCLELFDRFGWNPDETQIAAEQDRFFKRHFAY